MAKYEFKIEIKPREDEDTGQGPSIEDVDQVITEALRAAWPAADVVRVYDGSRPDLD